MCACAVCALRFFGSVNRRESFSANFIGNRQCSQPTKATGNTNNATAPSPKVRAVPTCRLAANSSTAASDKCSWRSSRS